MIEDDILALCIIVLGLLPMEAGLMYTDDKDRTNSTPGVRLPTLYSMATAKKPQYNERQTTAKPDVHRHAKSSYFDNLSIHRACYHLNANMTRIYCRNWLHEIMNLYKKLLLLLNKPDFCITCATKAWQDIAVKHECTTLYTEKGIRLERWLTFIRLWTVALSAL